MSCNKTGRYYNTDENRNSCLSSPPTDYYLDNYFKKYLKCDLSCNDCSETSTNCNSCKKSNPDNLKNYFSTDINFKKCYLRIIPPTGYYFDSGTNLFKKCDLSCRVCDSSASYCSSCSDNYFSLYNNPNSCVLDCPIKTWKNNLERKCSPCNQSCKSCIDDTTTCLECETNYLLLQDNKNLCYKDCPLTYVKAGEENKFCKKCPANCDICLLDNTCILCSLGFYFSDAEKKCVSRCDSAYFGNDSNRQCTPCTGRCLECLNTNNCISCIADYFLIPFLSKDNCVKVCPDGLYGEKANNKCEPCDKKCKSCKTTPKECYSCKNDYLYLKEAKTCDDQCPEKHYQTKNPLLKNPNNLDEEAFIKQLANSESLNTCEKCSI